MTDDTSELDMAIAELYSGPLDEFIKRRDALAKQLRATATREEAAAVKALRKPSRTAWSLNRAVADDPDSLAALGTAVNAVVHSQSTGGDVRGAMANLRTTVRRLAANAADAAAQAGQRLEASDIANAVLAIVAVPQSFADLSRGVLVDLPEAGGLDFLASIAPLPTTQSEATRARAAPEPARTTSPEKVAVNGAAARAAAAALETARGRARLAQQSLREAEAALRAAEAKVREAASTANEALSRFERARADAEQAAIREREAEEACRKHG